MSNDVPPEQLAASHAAFGKLKEFGESLKPIDKQTTWFWQILFELIDSAMTNYNQLRKAYDADDAPLLAWACRNLLELVVFTKYVLISEADARRFASDRLIDGCDIIRCLKTLELHINPQSDTTLLDDALTRMQAQMAAEAVTASRYLATSALADKVGMKTEFDCMNRVCSKLVHPTAWSIISVNKGENAFSQSRPILFTSGVQYGCELYLAIKEHNQIHGMKPKP
jgi:hypothetical protein